MIPWLATLAIAALFAMLVWVGARNPAVLERFPGGAKRLFAALGLQTVLLVGPLTAVAPIVFSTNGIELGGVWINGASLFLTAVLLGLILIYVARLMPAARPLLTDLTRARIEAALDRLPPYSRPKD